MRTRLATTADAGEIAEIYNREVAEGTATFDMVPRTLAEQRAWLRAHSGAHPCIVAVSHAGSALAARGAGRETSVGADRLGALSLSGSTLAGPGTLGSDSGAGDGDAYRDETAGSVLGWACLSPYRPRPAYATSVEDSIYVHPDHQGRGVGDLLLGDLVALADEHGFHAVFARIADAGAASVALHAKHGFELVGVEREVGRKFGRWLDVTVMQRLHPAQPKARSRPDAAHR